MDDLESRWTAEQPQLESALLLLHPVAEPVARAGRPGNGACDTGRSVKSPAHTACALRPARLTSTSGWCPWIGPGSRVDQSVVSPAAVPR